MRIQPVLIALLLFCSLGCSEDPVVVEEGIFEGDVILKSQEEVDEFSEKNYTQITGVLQLGTPTPGTDRNDITSVEGLSTISDVRSLLVLNTRLTSLEGLENIGSIEEFLLYKNHDLVAIDDLNLTGMNLQVQIIDNQSLESFSGFGNIETHTERILINYNPALTSIDGFEGLESVTELIIQHNDLLNNLDALSGLQEVGYILDITDNPVLPDLAGLSGLESARSVSISQNEQLNSLQGLDGLTALAENMDVHSNANLVDFCALQTLLSQEYGMRMNINITENKYNPTKEEILDGDCQS